MASSWANEIADEAGMPGLNFTAMLDDAQADARNGLSSDDKETAKMPGNTKWAQGLEPLIGQQISHLMSIWRHLQWQHWL